MIKMLHYSTNNTSGKEVLDISIATKVPILRTPLHQKQTAFNRKNKQVVDSSHVVVFQSGQGLGSL